MKFEYKEPEFKVVITSSQDVLTSSNPDTYHSSPFETGMEPIFGL